MDYFKKSGKVNKKILDYIGISVVGLLFIGSVIVGFIFSYSKNVVVGGDLNLEQYRLDSVPLDCRLPSYESEIESWKEYLSHY